MGQKFKKDFPWLSYLCSKWYQLGKVTEAGIWLSYMAGKCLYSKSPSYRQVPFWEQVHKSDLFVSPTKLA